MVSNGSGFQTGRGAYVLGSHDLDLRIADHKLAYSLYFSDPWGNLHEMTTYERDLVAAQLAG